MSQSEETTVNTNNATSKETTVNTMSQSKETTVNTNNATERGNNSKHNVTEQGSNSKHKQCHRARKQQLTQTMSQSEETVTEDQREVYVRTEGGLQEQEPCHPIKFCSSRFGALLSDWVIQSIISQTEVAKML